MTSAAHPSRACTVVASIWGLIEYQPIDRVLGDMNRNNVVDAADYVLWRKQAGASIVPGAGADANGDGLVNGTDFAIWRSNFGESYAAPAETIAQATQIAGPDADVSNSTRDKSGATARQLYCRS